MCLKKNYTAENADLWSKVEQKEKYELPLEYKAFINTYGAGCIGDFLHVFNALEEGEDGLFAKVKVIRDAWDFLREGGNEY